MTASTGVLDFFIVEASEYIERLDDLLAHAGPAGPNADSFGRYARALRGSATMSRQYGIADVAGAIERVARALRNRAMGWTPAASAAVVAAVDDLRLLVRAVRDWTAAEDRRAQARTAELDRLAPGPGGAVVPPPPPATEDAPVSVAQYLAAETADLARTLEQLVAAPEDTRGIAALADRVRALRGVADLKDMPPLPDVVDAVERALKGLELNTAHPGSAPSAKQKSLFATAGAVLRRASRDISTRGRPVPGAPEELAFHNAMAALPDEGGSADRIVPIAQLFFDDAGPHIVSAANAPPTSAAERFRMEVVSLAEHLRRVVGEARATRAPDARDHTSRELRSALRALGSAASSFGERQVARFAAEWSVKISTMNEAGLSALDRAATMLADPETRPEQLARALEQLAAPRSAQTAGRSTVALLSDDPALRTPSAPPTPVSSPVQSPLLAPTPPRAAAPVSAPRRPSAERRVPSPAVDEAWPDWPLQPTVPRPVPSAESPAASGDQLRAFLQDGISGLRRLEDQPLSPPAQFPDDEPVPIEHLLYRGRAALARAAELRHEWQRAGSTPSPEAMAELFDLLDLALVE
jgi:chemotaxis protein histidine kinase CheA